MKLESRVNDWVVWEDRDVHSPHAPQEQTPDHGKMYSPIVVGLLLLWMC